MNTAPASVEPTRDSLLTGPFLVIALVSVCYFASLGMLVATLPKWVEGDLSSSGVVIGIVIGSFAIAAAGVRPWAGQLGDRYGRRMLVAGGSAVVAVSIAGYALVDNVVLLIVLRLFTGIGEAGVFVGAATAVQDLAPPHRRGEAASYFSVSLYAGTAVGPILGERIADAHGYDATWIVAACLSALAALFAMRIPVGTKTTIRPKRLLHPAALRPGLVMLLGMMPSVAFSAFLAVYAKSLGIGGVGSVFAVLAVSVLVIRVVGARLPDQLGWRRASTVALLAGMTSSIVMVVWAAKPALYVAAVILAIGQSLLFPALFTAVINEAGEDERSHATGTFSLFFDLAAGIGAPLIGLVVALSSHRGAYVTAAVLAALGFVAQHQLRRSESAGQKIV
ncbi:MAG TPA: MFS transporter [Ilumatobacteraceae bacterium]|nr:MFS transporter [Ilumatobacteraceae bacterium]